MMLLGTKYIKPNFYIIKEKLKPVNKKLYLKKLLGKKNNSKSKKESKHLLES